MQISRRRFVLYAVGAILGPHARAAPPNRIVRIGLVMTEYPFVTAAALDSVVEGLREQGYVAGKNLVLVTRTASFPDGPMRVNVEEILAMKPDVVVAGCGWSTSVMLRMTKTVPIVMVAASDPVGRGWVPSLARPGANVTGVSGMMTELPAKMLDHLRLLLPELKAVGIGLNTRVDTHKNILREVETTARMLGVRVVPIDLNPLTTTALMRDALHASGVQAIMNIPDDNLFWASVDRIIAASNELRLPLATFRSDFAEQGALMSYGANPRVLFKRTAAYVDRILNGASPGQLPVELPSQLEFGINLKQAEVLGITIPRAVLMQANTLIK